MKQDVLSLRDVSGGIAGGSFRLLRIFNCEGPIRRPIALPLILKASL